MLSAILFGMLLVFMVALPINFFISKSRYFREQKNDVDIPDGAKVSHLTKSVVHRHM